MPIAAINPAARHFKQPAARAGILDTSIAVGPSAPPMIASEASIV
jgi:hypothetical protein